MPCLPLFFRDHQEYLERPFPLSFDLFLNGCGRYVTDFRKPSLLEKPFQVPPIKTKMQHANIIAVKRAVLRVQIGGAEHAAWQEQTIPLPEQLGDVRHMMQGHAAHHQMKCSPYLLPPFKIRELDLNVLQARPADLVLENAEHPFRTVSSSDRIHEGLQPESH